MRGGAGDSVSGDGVTCDGVPMDHVHTATALLRKGRGYIFGGSTSRRGIVVFPGATPKLGHFVNIVF